MSYSTKNYTEQGGEKTHIGGKLIIEEGGSVEGLPSAKNVPESKADTVGKLKDDLNSLITGLKEAGYVEKDSFAIGSNLIPSPTEEALAANHAKVVSVECDGSAIVVTVPVDELEAFPSSVPEQGTHKWIGLEVKTGVDPVAGVVFDGYALTAEDAAEAASVGCADGSFVLYIKAESVKEEPRTFVLTKAGYAAKEVTIVVADPE